MNRSHGLIELQFVCFKMQIKKKISSYGDAIEKISHTQHIKNY